MRTLRTLVLMKRHRSGLPLFPTETVIDSQSVRTGLPQAVSGIDGGKRVKGIKRHIAVDMNGYPLGMDITTANVHDSKGADRLMARVLSDYKQIAVIKADMGYRGAFRDMPLEELGITLENPTASGRPSDASRVPLPAVMSVKTIVWLEVGCNARLWAVIFASLIGHDARIAPSSGCENPSPKAALTTLIFYEMGPNIPVVNRSRDIYFYVLRHFSCKCQILSLYLQPR